MQYRLTNGQNSDIIESNIKDQGGEYILNVKINMVLRRGTLEGWRIGPRKIKDYELVYVISGYGEIMIGGKQISVGAGDFICFKPGVTHSLWLSREPYMVFYGVHFTPQPKEIMKEIPDYVHLEERQWADQLLKMLYVEHRQKGYLGAWKEEIILQQILSEHLTRLHSTQEPISVARIRKVLSYIHNDPCRDYSLSDLLGQVRIQKSVFLQSFRSVTGTTPLQYIINLRLETACDLLAETDLQISQISDKCGFKDPFYFSRCFKKKYSLSPRQYREHLKYN